VSSRKRIEETIHYGYRHSVYWLEETEKICPTSIIFKLLQLLLASISWSSKGNYLRTLNLCLDWLFFALNEVEKAFKKLINHVKVKGKLNYAADCLVHSKERQIFLILNWVWSEHKMADKSARCIYNKIQSEQYYLCFLNALISFNSISVTHALDSGNYVHHFKYEVVEKSIAYDWCNRR